MQTLKKLLFERSRNRSVVSSGSSPPFTTLTNPQFAAMNTAVSNALSADGFTWAQANPMIYDTYGNCIMTVQRNNGARLVFAFSNDNGATWQDNSAINDLADLGEILTRSSFCYDSVNDCLHAFAYYNNSVVVYRRYGITRSGNNIASITWTRGVSPNAVIDGTDAVTEYSHPVCYKIGNYVCGFYSVSAASGADIIGVRCDISSNVDAGATVSNWISIGTGNTSTIGHAPSTTSYKVMANSATASVLDLSIKQLANQDLFYAYWKAASTWKMRRATWDNANTRWNPLATEISMFGVVISGTDTGYSLKKQLMSKICEDSSGNVFLACPVWLSNVAGDTVRLAKITPADVVTTVDVYSANGAHSYAPTCDLSIIDDKLIISYLKTSTLDTYVRVYDTSLNPLSNEVLATSTYDADIPLLSPRKMNNKLFMAFRQIGTPPQIGYKGTMDFA